MSSQRLQNRTHLKNPTRREGDGDREGGAAAPPADSAGSRLALFVSLMEHGETMGAAARRSGLTSAEVLDWIEDDALVAEEMEETRGRIRRQVRLRLTGLAHTAVDVVERALSRGDATVAMAMLKELGVAEPAADTGRPHDDNAREENVAEPD